MSKTNYKEKKEKRIGGDYIDTIYEYVESHKKEVFYNFVLLMIILIQTPFLIAGLDGVTVEVDLPPRGIATVSNDKASELYYRLWAEHFSNNNEYQKKDKKTGKTTIYSFSIMDFDYLNVDDKVSYLMEYYKPRSLIRDKVKIVNFAKNVKVKMISQRYDVEDIVVKLFDGGHKAEALYKGVAFQSYGETKKNQKLVIIK
jgi:hypothetical protein